MSGSVADSSIQAKGLVKRYGSHPAVDHVSFEIRRGEFFSILGPSGAGKTSLLRLLAGFEQPDAGDILIDGRSMAGVPPNRRPVNLVFQSYALFPHLSVFRNVAFGLEMQRTPARKIESRVGAMLDLVRLGPARDRLPAQLSGGEQQRVALARALVNRPSVLLLDEPLAALDERLRQDMQQELKAIQGQVGITFVCVTHHQAEALAMSDRLAVMHRGTILQIGRPRDIYEAPADRFVAQFVGTSNELSGTLVGVEAGVGTMRAPSLVEGPPLRVRAAPGLQTGAGVVLLLRPEQVRVSRSEPAEPDENRLAGTVENVIYAGNRQHCLVRIGESVLWTVDLPAHAGAPSVGARVGVVWKASDGALFPA